MAYQALRYVSFSENFASVLNEWSLVKTHRFKLTLRVNSKYFKNYPKGGQFQITK